MINITDLNVDIVYLALLTRADVITILNRFPARSCVQTGKLAAIATALRLCHTAAAAATTSCSATWMPKWFFLESALALPPLATDCSFSMKHHNPVLPHSWVEVSHAAWVSNGEAGIYFHPIDGTGVSLNTGNTLILYDSCRTPYCDHLYDFVACLGMSDNRSHCLIRFPAFKAGVTGVDLDALHTVQIMDHLDDANDFHFNEIVLLESANDDVTLQAAIRQYDILMCGRHPYLHECDTSSEVWQLWDVHAEQVLTGGELWWPTNETLAPSLFWYPGDSAWAIRESRPLEYSVLFVRVASVLSLVLMRLIGKKTTSTLMV